MSSSEDEHINLIDEATNHLTSYLENGSASRRTSNASSRKSSAVSAEELLAAALEYASRSGTRKSSVNSINPTSLRNVDVTTRTTNVPSNFSKRNSSSKQSGDGVTNRIALDLMELIKNKSQPASRAPTSQSNIIAMPLSAQMLSEIEALILRSSEPVVLNESEEVEVLGQRGVLLNKEEIINWRGVIPISEYLINEDPNPEVITKRSNQKIEYIQELAIRYLRPPTPPAPGEIVITQEANVLTPPAPPLVIRQQPARPSTPEPLVIREAPPLPPKAVGRKLISISGKRIPPPPRKVVIERLAELPAKPQSVIIERWLPYAEVKRRVIFQAAPADPIVVAPKNTIIQWQAPQVRVRKELKYLGVIRANPVEYVQTYGVTLKVSNDLPDFVHEIKAPQEVGVLAAEYTPLDHHELEGDVHALNLINLDKEGLSAYRKYLSKYADFPADRSIISRRSSNSSEKRSVSAYSPHIPSSSALIVESVLSRPRSNTSTRKSEKSFRAPSSAEELLSAAFDYAASNQGSRPASGKSVSNGTYRKPSVDFVDDVQPITSTLISAPSRPDSRKISVDQTNASETASTSENSGLNELIGQIFQAIDINNTGTITVEEAEKTLLRLNTRLSKNYGESDIKSFFEFLDVNQNGTLTFEEFRRAFLNIAQ